jgi:hydroxyethylthiazole kinase-like uncharacterized protein yjeF
MSLLARSEVQAVDRERLVAWPLPEPAADDDKNARGRVLIVGGAREIPGAAILAGIGAMRAGAGKLQMAVPGSVAPSIAIAVPEARVVGVDETEDGAIAADGGDRIADLAERAQAVVLGPGMTDAQEAIGVLHAIVDRCRGLLVVDAGAIDCLRDAARDVLHPMSGRVVLTPNATEAAFLLGREVDDVEARPLETACEMAASWGAVVALKGATTYTADPGGEVWADDAGNVGLATSGSGDVLSGVIGGMAARGAGALQAAVWGVHVHAVAGERLAERIAPVGYLARELLDELPRVLADLRHRT